MPTVPRTLNIQTRSIPSLLRSVASASKARIAVARSPYAAGPAKAAGRFIRPSPRLPAASHATAP